MKKILLDSSVIIDFLRRKNKEDSLLYKFTVESYQLSISIITHAELYSGSRVWENKEDARELQIVLQGIKILPINENISKKAGQIRAIYKVALLDALIAATALENKLKLVTLNIKDFEKVPKLTLWKKND